VIRIIELKDIQKSFKKIQFLKELM